VTSDSDFAYLCRKLRERGASVCIVGETKTPDALRNASDEFFEWTPPEPAEDPSATPAEKAAAAVKVEAVEAKPAAPKKRPRMVIEAVAMLAGETSEGKARLADLGNYLKRVDPGFSTKAYGYSGLLDMVRSYDKLALSQDAVGHWLVGLSPKAKGGAHADQA
jgi:hypothetical protein